MEQQFEAEYEEVDDEVMKKEGDNAAKCTQYVFFMHLQSLIVILHYNKK